ncbi:MAG: fatty acid desaturase [Planctomycetota bacterium]
MTKVKERECKSLPRPAKTNPIRIYRHFVFSLVVIHLLASLALVPWFFSWAGMWTFLVGFNLFGYLGINVCYHRLLTHRSFMVPKWLEYCLAIIGICCLQDSPARWVAIHRMHHQHSDKESDPHSPRVGLFWGHLGWLVVKNDDHDNASRFEHYARDILRDPFYFWMERNLRWVSIYAAHAVLFYLVGLAIGWTMTSDWRVGNQLGSSLLIWGVFLRTVVVWHITWMVNSIGHVFGYQNYETGDSSRNNVLCAMLAGGDGWHNNHHAYPRSAAHGHKWWEFDMTYRIIRLLEVLGLAKNVVKAPLDRAYVSEKEPAATVTVREPNLDSN